MPTRDLVVRIGGEGGEGVISTGELLTLALARAKQEVFTFRTYPAEIKGGPAMFQVRTSEEELLSHGDRIDIVIAFNAEACRLHGNLVRRGGAIVYDPADHDALPDHCTTIPLPMSEIAEKQIGARIAKNMVALGAAGALVGLTDEFLRQLITSKFARKGEEVVKKNHAALNAGFHYIAENYPKLIPPPVKPPADDRKRIVVSGNEAAGLGALAAGVRVFAGYPITPASDLFEWLARELPKFGGRVVQAEDEIASLGIVIGAQYTGAKAMTATSGPGLCLMVEEMGYAGMAEIPVVIFDAQRAGPSTGMPSKTEQGDLGMAVYAGHSDQARIAIAPVDVEDCFQVMVDAFNLAESYQCPVIVLSDQSLSMRHHTVTPFDPSKVQLRERLKPSPEELRDGENGHHIYRRYKVTETGISPMSIPGMAGGTYAATGLEHDEIAEPCYTPDGHRTMNEKRFRKLKLAAKEPHMWRRWGSPDAEIGIIGWGSTSGSVREAAQQAADEGIETDILYLRMVYPFPDGIVEEFAKGKRVLIVPEMNFSGQLATLLSGKYGIWPIRVNKAEGLPFSPSEILKVLQEVHHGRLQPERLPRAHEADLVPGMR